MGTSLRAAAAAAAVYASLPDPILRSALRASSGAATRGATASRVMLGRHSWRERLRLMRGAGLDAAA